MTTTSFDQDTMRTSRPTLLHGPLSPEQVNEVVQNMLMEVDLNHSALAQIHAELEKIAGGGDYRARYIVKSGKPLDAFIPTPLQENIRNVQLQSQQQVHAQINGGGGGGFYRSSGGGGGQGGSGGGSWPREQRT